MKIVLPVVYLLIGWIIGKLGFDGRRLASMLLTRFAIPIVIVWSVATQFSAMGIMIIATMPIMAVLYQCSRWWSHDPVEQLCFSFLNIGWLGLPIATSLLGPSAATIMIAAYVGSSIFGNTVGANVLAGQRPNLPKVITSPPVLSLLAGMLLIPFNTLLTDHVLPNYLYTTAKQGMSVLGMLVLGLWLSETRLCREDLMKALRPNFYRVASWSALITLTGGGLYLIGISLNRTQWETLYLICLLPPAAGIIVLETHYCGTGRSASPILCGTLISLILIGCYALLLPIIGH